MNKGNGNTEEFDAKESLQIIRGMIETSRHTFYDNSAYFLLWGWAVFVGCLLQYYLMVIARSPHHYYAWLVTPVALIIFFILLIREKKKQQVRTFISEANGYVWFIIGISFLPLSFVFTKIGWQYCFPFYIQLYGIGTYISGSLLRFKPLRYGGLICMVLFPIAAYVQYDYQMLITAFAILVSYIIPGYLLRIHYRKQQTAAA